MIGEDEAEAEEEAKVGDKVGEEVRTADFGGFTDKGEGEL